MTVQPSGHVRKASLLMPIVAAVIALATAYGYSVFRQNGDLLLIQALHGSSAPVRAVAAISLRRFTDCPDADFAPSTAIGMLVAAWDEHVPAGRADRLLAQLQALGCDINGRSAQGLTPLHGAVLFNNPTAVHSLLQAGANPNINTDIPRADGSRGEYDAPTFAARLADAGAENFDAVITALANLPAIVPRRTDER